MGGGLYCLKSRLVNYMGCTSVRLSMLEEHIDMSIVHSNVRHIFCVFLITVVATTVYVQYLGKGPISQFFFKIALLLLYRRVGYGIQNVLHI